MCIRPAHHHCNTTSSLVFIFNMVANNTTLTTPFIFEFQPGPVDLESNVNHSFGLPSTSHLLQAFLVCNERLVDILTNPSLGRLFLICTVRWLCRGERHSHHIPLVNGSSPSFPGLISGITPPLSEWTA